MESPEKERRRKKERKKEECAVIEVSLKPNKYENLKDHIHKKHGGIMDIQCPDCDMKSASKNIHDLHIQLQHGYGNFECPNCSFKCHHSLALHAHISEMHNQGTESPPDLTKCPSCKTKVNLNNLDQHYPGCLKAKK